KARCDPIAYFTLWLVGFTGILAVSTIGLWIVTWRSSVKQSSDMQASIAAAQKSAQAAQVQANVMAAVEGPLPLVIGLKLAQYEKIPGETLLIEEVPAGTISPNCRIFFALENKGRTPL